MKPSAFDYAVPKDVETAKSAVRESDGTTKFVAGNQSLGPMLNLRLVRASGLVDISRLAGLRRIAENERATFIGAATTHAEIEDGEVTDPTGGWMKHAASNIAYRAVRNRGTIGGSICHADPAADWVIVMIALGADAIIDGPNGQRIMALSDFITGPFSSALEDGEILLGVEITKPGEGAIWGYWKYMRQVGEFAKASAAVYNDPVRNVMRCTIGALDQKPLTLSNPKPIFNGDTTPEDALRSAFPEKEPAQLTLHSTALKRALQIAHGKISE